MRAHAHAAAILALAAALAAGCSDSDEPDAPAPPPSSSVAAPPTPSATQAPKTGADEPSDGQTPQVADSGFTSFDDEPASGGPFVNVAILVHNPSDDWALAVEVSVELRDAAGEPIRIVTDPNSSDTSPNAALSIHSIAPGATQAVVDHVYADRAGASSIRVSVEDAGYFPGDHPDLFAFDVSEPQHVIRDDGGLRVEFAVTSPFPQQRSAATYAAYRDSAEKIIGGSLWTDAADQAYPPGEVQTSIVADTFGLPPNITLSTVEVYASATAN